MTSDRGLINEAAEIIERGGIVAIPTETVYGLACRSDSKVAVDRLYKIKNRPYDKPLSYAVSSVDAAVKCYLSTMIPFGYRLLERFSPGPLTLVYYSLEDKKTGVRIPSYAVARKIIESLNVPVYLSSANISGGREAIDAKDVEDIFGDSIDLIVDSGKTLYGKPSTIVDLTCNPFKILREGAIKENDIIETFIRKRVLFVCTGNTCRSPMAEFMLRKYLFEYKPYLNDRYQIISRGLSAQDGLSASKNTIELMKDRECLDLKGFVSKKLTKWDILSADLIFAMEDYHKNYILNLEPFAEGRVFNIKKFLPSGLEEDIPDPISKDFKVYERVYDLIRNAVLELKDWL